MPSEAAQRHQVKVHLPPVFSINISESSNYIKQLTTLSWQGDAIFEPLTRPRVKGYFITPSTDHPAITLLTNASRPSPDDLYVLRLKDFNFPTGDHKIIDLSAATWLKHPALIPVPETTADFERHKKTVQDSWENCFSYKQENLDNGIKGLRLPQIGALHAVQAHLSIHRTPATVVLPTGTGKTETMLSTLLVEKCGCLLVIVPTNALRTQIAEKFITLGILKEFGLVADDAKNPVVGILKHRPKTSDDVESFFRKCNVVIATMSGLGQCARDIQECIARYCTHLFIDEAHHVGARTWNDFKQAFKDVPIIQFTATPYRNDEKPIGEKFIFNYSLHQAQQDGYFKPISFKPVIEFNPKLKDKAIADAAIEQLREDFSKGHIVMARVNSIPRAKEVFAIYQKFPEFSPVEIHTGIKVTEREEIREKIINGQSRIVVCVDMLGEGFDLPELKIAAFHDIRHSLPVTLQLAGRFTRSRPDLGDATFIANIAEVNVKEEIRKLYQLDVDWNRLLPQISDSTIQKELDLVEFLDGFDELPEKLSLQNVCPAMSTVAYRTRCKRWHPDNFGAGIASFNALDKVYYNLNSREQTLIIMTGQQVPVAWAGMNEISSWDWQLYILHWDQSKQLLFIHSSSNAGHFKELAKAVAEEVTLVTGPDIFRCLATVNRLKLQNVGLLEQYGRQISFTMRAGSDVESGISETQKQKAVKSNLFGTGFENGHRTSIGCSNKGRIWSRQTTNLRELIRWCSSVGEKLNDNSLDPEKVLQGTLEPKLVSERPHSMPLIIEWPDVIYRNAKTIYTIGLQKTLLNFHEVDISLLGPSEEGALQFEISDGNIRAIFELVLFKKNGVTDYRFDTKGGSKSTISFGNREMALSEFFNENPPTIWFANGASLTGNNYVRLRGELPPYPANRLDVWDWAGIDITKESQGIEKYSDSIQYRVIQKLKEDDSCIVLFDDDGTGESADIVAISETEHNLQVKFYHCKYSQAENPGARINDLYEVCGQAQKSIRWMDCPTELFNHLMQREPRIWRGKQGTRYEVGNQDDLFLIREKSRCMDVRLQIFIVQPGLSRKSVSSTQLELLAVTESYLLETFNIPFGVICSE